MNNSTVANNLNIAMEPTKPNASRSRVNGHEIHFMLNEGKREMNGGGRLVGGPWSPGSIYVDLRMLGLAKKCGMFFY